MSIVRHLMRHGEKTADELAVELHVEIEHAYLELVRAEGDGLVRVNVDGNKRCTWEFAHDWAEVNAL